jgi:SAM-dependent methyltransferase
MTNRKNTATIHDDLGRDMNKFPPRIGSPPQFETLRNFLESIGYKEEEICKRLGLPSVDCLDLVALPDPGPVNEARSDTLDIVIRFFLLGQFIERADRDTHFPAAAWEAAEALGLIERWGSDSRIYASTVALYPIGDLYFVSDRWNNPDHTPKQSFPDVVYPALTKSTREFLRFLPTDPCESFLEVCAGSGIAAIRASRRTTHIWSADITGRATHFANFNVALNGTYNVTVVQGDLYEPLNAQTFDRIAAHPPYMPVLRPAEVYYDGGEDGEQLTRRIVEGLLLNLRPGGRLYCRTLGTDRKGNPFEGRVREWMGAAEKEFDVAFFVSKNIETMRFAMDSAIRWSTGQAEVSQWLAQFVRLGIQEILTGMLVVQRRATNRGVFTVRRSLAPTTTVVETEKLLRWQSVMTSTSAERRLAELCPVASPLLQITACHRLVQGQFVLSDFTLSNSFPFLMDCKVEPWTGSLLTLCDGTRTVQQIHAECRQSGLIHENTPLKEFARMFDVLVSGGFLEIPEPTMIAASE